ncbi:MAG: hypothetical protein HOL66_09640 [Rhodospirillaceae bacterium]|jgi:hypothetical protein|nr:hypothetical protein [Rhodospirillaceae bacterium]MBT5244498.1 hypothetical protein [Rhodospirillaceae bacterium]MBT5560755.1 hypothetical protein [Rhodospirillaceae bacterium]MBT6241594.1 hypothetical protein [Rhodospirillaceae bacterium]MBT7136380.1 hypothetical protein [Rhodospirillaceae bacterium]
MDKNFGAFQDLFWPWKNAELIKKIKSLHFNNNLIGLAPGKLFCFLGFLLPLRERHLQKQKFIIRPGL